MRINAGCGPVQPEGWENVDSKDWGQRFVADLEFLWDDVWMDNDAEYTVCHHVLQDIPWDKLVPSLTAMRRVTSGWVRISVPDIEAATFAYHSKDADFFPISDDHEESLDGKYLMYLTQAGKTKSLFTFSWLEELCFRAGFTVVHKSHYKQTCTTFLGIIDLDSRPDESIFIEAKCR